MLVNRLGSSPVECSPRSIVSASGLLIAGIALSSSSVELIDPLEARTRTVSTSPLMPEQLIACMAAGREPTERELFAQAERMRIVGAAGLSASQWHRLAIDGDGRLIALRLAKLALGGSIRDWPHRSAGS